MAIDDWDGNEYELVLRSQQRGRKLRQHGDTLSTRSPTGGGVREHIQSEQLCLGMDITLALHWESLINNSCGYSSSSREFEFDMVATEAESGDDVGISPADELFYKGQLLPLHLRPRLQMVEKLSFENQQESKADDDIDPPSVMVPEPLFSDMSPAGLPRLFQPGYAKYYLNNSTDVAAIEAAVDYRSSSSFRSQISSSMWESAADNSSRDSSGSSQDVCFASNELDTSSTSDPKPPVKSSKEPPFLHDREVFSTHSKQSDKFTFPSWIRPPFKWKVLFGVKQQDSKPSTQEQSPHAQTQRSNRFAESYSACAPASHSNARSPLSPSKQRNRERAWSTEIGQATSVVLATAEDTTDEERRESGNIMNTWSEHVQRRRMHDPYHLRPAKNGENRVRSTLEVDRSESGFGIAGKYEGAPEFRHSQSLADSETAEGQLFAAGGDRERSKSSDRWTKYIKMLKPRYYGKMDNARMSPAPAMSSSSRKSSRLSFIKPTTERRKPGPSRKSLSGNSIFPSMSQTSRMAAIGWTAPRRSNASDSNCGLVRQISHSTISDLQSSLQGAIAHCKQSQSSSPNATTGSSLLLRNIDLLAP